MLMPDDILLSLVYAAYIALSSMPLGLMLGADAPCSPFCYSCQFCDYLPRTDPRGEGTWVPSGSWASGDVTWTFSANPGDDSGETWYFYGSLFTSDVFKTDYDEQDFANPCNWYSSKTTSPSEGGAPFDMDKRSSTLPPTDAVIHVYSPISTAKSGPVTVKSAFFWENSELTSGSELTTTSTFYDGKGTTFNDNSANRGTINNGATFNDTSDNYGVVNGGAVFNDNAQNFEPGEVNDGATFNDNAINRNVVNDGATFNDDSEHALRFFAVSIVNGGATFNQTASNSGTVNDGATFNDNSVNTGFGDVNGGATFNDNSTNNEFGTVNDGATFNDSACSKWSIGSFFATPCARKFVTHPTDLPTCNGTAPGGCDNAADTCGCG